MAPMASSAREEFPGAAVAEEDSSQDTSQKIQDEESSVRRVQEWWCDGHGPAAVTKSPILACIDTTILAEIISAGGGYHTILTADRLDGLHRRLGNGAEPVLEPLRKALQTRGGTKAQARVVGMLLFKEARALHLHCEDGSSTPGTTPPVEEAAATALVQEDVRLDESWAKPHLYICSDSYPEGAQMALRSGPNSKSSLLATLPANTEYYATGIIGDFLQVRVQIDGAFTSAYALHRMGDVVLLVPAAERTVANSTEPAASPDSKLSSKEVVLEEAWSPPRRFVCSENYPEGAQMAVRAAPTRDSKQVATIAAGADYFAMGRCGDYLQIKLETDGVTTTAYVTHTIGDMVLLVPAETDAQAASVSTAAAAPAARAAAAAVAAAEAATAAAAAEAATGSRIVALEAKVAAQDRQIQALQSEMAQMRAQLNAVALAFRPLAAS